MDEMTTSDGEPEPKASAAPEVRGGQNTVALIGFILVAAAQASNMILARGLAGSVPPFALAFFRWSIIAAGLAPFALVEIRSRRLVLARTSG